MSALLRHFRMAAPARAAAPGWSASIAPPPGFAMIVCTGATGGDAQW